MDILAEELRNWRMILSKRSPIAYVDDTEILNLISLYGTSSHDALFGSSSFPTKLSLRSIGLDCIINSFEVLFETDIQSFLAPEVGKRLLTNQIELDML